MSNKVLIKIEDVSRIFPIPGGEFTALKKINATIKQGSFTILKGRSGSGKTTLMNIAGCLDYPSEGKVFLEDREVSSLTEKERENLRRKDFGFVFQSVSLLSSLNAYQNVEFSMRLAGCKINAEAQRRVKDCLRMVGLSNRMTHMPAELSGGEQQRVAIARAIAHRPRVIFADEPTAELDSAMAAKVTELFKMMTVKEGITVLMTTHDVGLMGAADSMIELENGERVNA